MSASNLAPPAEGPVAQLAGKWTGDLPYSPPLRGGVDAPSKNGQVPLIGADGVVRIVETYIPTSDHPVCAQFWNFMRADTPPPRGGEYGRSSSRPSFSELSNSPLKPVATGMSPLCG